MYDPYDDKRPSLSIRHAELELTNLARISPPPSHNCYSWNQRQRCDIISNFVQAIAGMLLLKSRVASAFDSYLTASVKILQGEKTTDGMVNFFFGKRYEYDIDTMACTELFLLLFHEQQRTHYELDAKAIATTFEENRCDRTGSFLTWFDRKGNNIDFMANLNVYVLLTKLGVDDNRLRAYLVRSASSFLKTGSFYYSDIAFPLVLVEFYHKIGLLKRDDTVFMSLTSPNQFNQVFRLPRHCDFAREQGVETSVSQVQPQIDESRQYFNSSSATFHSRLLDLILLSYYSTGEHISPRSVSKELTGP